MNSLVDLMAKGSSPRPASVNIVKEIMTVITFSGSATGFMSFVISVVCYYLCNVFCTQVPGILHRSCTIKHPMELVMKWNISSM